MNISFTRKDFLSYTLTPQLIPRARRIFSGGFAHLAFFMALVYRAVGLIPTQHPCTEARNIGKFGLRYVIALAANNIRLDRRHIDQLVIFMAILAAMVILFIQFILLFVFVTVGSAQAADQPGGYGEFFSTTNANTDLAMRILSHIFGVPELFGAEKGSVGFHLALQGLFQFYSIALIIVAVLIIIYFVFAVVAETAQHGVPFGRRFNHVWAPIRLVVAAGLLIPVGTGGLNAAQYITLYAAKFGSNFATNGWLKFNDTLGESWKSTGETDKSKLVATPNVPDIQHVGAFMTIVKTCAVTTEQKYKNAGKTRLIKGYLVKNPATGSQSYKDFETATFLTASEFFNKGDIRIRFGELDSERYTKEKGNVMPWCGEIVLLTTNTHEPGAVTMQNAYYDLLQELWEGGILNINTAANAYMRRYAGIPTVGSIGSTASAEKLITPEFKNSMFEYLKGRLETTIKKAVQEQTNSESWTKDDEKLRGYGWAGAGVWYNKLAQVNGVLVAAVDAMPVPRLMPQVMEDVKKYKSNNSNSGKIDPESMYTPDVADGKFMGLEGLEDPAVAKTLNEVYKDWLADGGIRTDAMASHIKTTGNAVIDFINLIFGTSGLFDMCRNTDIHPLAQLSNVGKGLVEHSIKNFGASLGFGIGSILFPHVGPALSAISSFLVSIGMIGLVAGFILFYIIPFLPFLYFFLAVGEWVKGLFEAMVGVPLWALAHLRIDGEGLPGDAAVDGYYLILEVFLRPIMIIFGLLASLSIFAAMVRVLNEIFYLAVSNLSGFNPETASACGSGPSASPSVGSMEWFRGPVDEFFFTVVYAIVVYMIGMSCFKLIDLIPDNILRWLGTGAKSFGQGVGDQTEGFVDRMTVGGGAVAAQVKGASSSLGTAGQKAVQGLMGSKK